MDKPCPLDIHVLALPEGKTCSDCVHVRRCVAFGFSTSNATQCEFGPPLYQDIAMIKKPNLTVVAGDPAL